MVKQTKKIKANSSKSTTTVANGEEFVKVDVNGQMTLIPLANLKTAIFGNMNVNAIEDGIFIMYHRKSDNYPLMVKPHKWASTQSGGEVADGVVVVEGGRVLVVAPTESATKLNWGSANVAGGGTDRPCRSIGRRIRTWFLC